MRREAGFAGIIPPAGELLEFSELRSLESLRRPQGLTSIGLISAASLAIWAFMDVPPLLPWLGVMLGFFVLHTHVVASLPDRGDRRHLLLPVITLVATGLCYICGGLILWVQSDPGLRILSLLFLFVALLNTLSNRVQLRLLLAMDLGLTGVGVLARAGWLWYAEPGVADTILVSAALLICYLFFCKVAWNVLRTREALALASDEALLAERGRAMEQLTGGVAHDFNNLLTAVLGNMELARLSRDPRERDELMDEAERAARRGADLTGRLLAMASCARLRPLLIEPGDLARQLPPRAAELLGPAHQLRLQVEAGLPRIWVDGDKALTCLLELVANARDAMTSGGTIVLSVQAGQGVKGPVVSFELRDTGSGIPPDVMPLVCEPYFTTKPVGQGSGLGLAMLRGFAEQSGGTFELSSPGARGGTCARLNFPAAAQGGLAASGGSASAAAE